MIPSSTVPREYILDNLNTFSFIKTYLWHTVWSVLGNISIHEQNVLFCCCWVEYSINFNFIKVVDSVVQIIYILTHFSVFLFNHLLRDGYWNYWLYHRFAFFFLQFYQGSSWWIGIFIIIQWTSLSLTMFFALKSDI